MKGKIREVRAERGMGIWGNYECAQCGACCIDWHKYLFGINERETERCKSFEIREGKAYCLDHEKERMIVCESYFCGDSDFITRFRDRRDEKLRDIAEMIGTVPESYRIPKLIPVAD